MSSLTRVARDNEALIRDLQHEFSEMKMLSTLADKRRQTEDVARAAGQPGSPATLPFAGGFISAVSPPVAAPSSSAFVDVSSQSSPLRRLSMNFAATSSSGASSSQSSNITSPTVSAALRRTSVNSIFPASSDQHQQQPNAGAAITLGSSARYAPHVSAIPETDKDDEDDDGSASRYSGSASSAAAAPHLTRLNLAAAPTQGDAGRGGASIGLAPGINLPHKLARPSLTSRVSEAIASAAAATATQPPPRREAPRAPGSSSSSGDANSHSSSNDDNFSSVSSASATAVRQTGILRRNSPPPFGDNSSHLDPLSLPHSGGSVVGSVVGGPASSAAVHSKGSAAYSHAAQAAAVSQAAHRRAETLRTIIAGETAGIPATSTLAVLSNMANEPVAPGSVAGASAVAEWAAQVQARKEATLAAQSAREESVQRQKEELGGAERVMALALSNLPSYRSQSLLTSAVTPLAASSPSALSSSPRQQLLQTQGRYTETILAGAVSNMAGANPLAQQLALTARSTANSIGDLSGRPSRSAPSAPGAGGGTPSPTHRSNAAVPALPLGSTTTTATAIARALSSSTSAVASRPATGTAGGESLLPEWLVTQPQLPVYVAPAPTAAAAVPTAAFPIVPTLPIKQTVAATATTQPIQARPPPVPVAEKPQQQLPPPAGPKIPGNVLMMANTAVPSTRPQRLQMVSQAEYQAVLQAQSARANEAATRNALVSQLTGGENATANTVEEGPIPGTPRQMKIYLPSTGQEEVVSVNETLVIPTAKHLVAQQLAKEKGLPASAILKAPDISVATTQTAASLQESQQQQQLEMVSKPIPAMYQLQAQKKGASIAGTVSMRRPSLDYEAQLEEFVGQHQDKLLASAAATTGAAVAPPFKPFSTHDVLAAEIYAATGSPERSSTAGSPASNADSGGKKKGSGGRRASSVPAGGASAAAPAASTDLLVSAGIVKEVSHKVKKGDPEALLSRIQGAPDSVVARAYLTTARRNSVASNANSSIADAARIRQHFAQRRGSTGGSSLGSAAIGVDGDGPDDATAEETATQSSYDDPEAEALLQRAKGLTAAANAMVGAAKSLSQAAAKSNALLQGGDEVAAPVGTGAASKKKATVGFNLPGEEQEQQPRQQPQKASKPQQQGQQQSQQQQQQQPLLSPKSMNVLKAAADAVGSPNAAADIIRAADDPAVLAEQVKQLESRLGVLRNTLREKDRQAAEAAVRAAGGLQLPRRRNSVSNEGYNTSNNGGGGRRVSFDSAGYNHEGYQDESYEDEDNESFSGVEANDGNYLDGDPRFPLPSFGGGGQGGQRGANGQYLDNDPRFPLPSFAAAPKKTGGAAAAMPPRVPQQQQALNYHYHSASSEAGSVPSGAGGIAAPPALLKQKQDNDVFTGIDPGTELADADDPPDVVLKGRLAKPGSLGTFWNVRYCVLTTDYLVYYASKEDAAKEMAAHRQQLKTGGANSRGLGGTVVTRKGAVDLATVTIAMGTGAVKGSPSRFSFQLIAPKRVYVFSAATEASLLNWVGAVSTVLGVDLNEVLASGGPEYASIGALTVGGQGALLDDEDDGGDFSPAPAAGRGGRRPQQQQQQQRSRGQQGRGASAPPARGNGYYAYGLQQHEEEGYGDEEDYYEEEEGYGDGGRGARGQAPQRRHNNNNNFSTAFYAK